MSFFTRKVRVCWPFRRWSLRLSLGIAVLVAYLTCCSTFSPLRADPNDIVGYVFKVQGHWRLAPQFTGDLGLGYGLRSKDVIRLTKPDPKAFIYVFLVDGNVTSRDCSKSAGDCQSALEVVSGAPSQDMTARLRAIWKRLQPPRPHSEIVASRGSSGVQELRDSVLFLDHSWPDLKPALTSVPNGKWNVEFTPAGRRARPMTLTLVWTTPDAVIKSGPPISQGLYKLRLVDDLDEGTNTAVVLVTRSDPGSRFASDLEDARRLTKNWSNDNVREDFMDLVLLGLSQEQSESK